MKRTVTILLVCLCMLFVCGCSQKDPEYIRPANFYYCNQTVSYNSHIGVIRPEVREAHWIGENIDRFMEEYLRGPLSDDLYSIIPAKTVLLSVQVQENTAFLNFSQELSSLSGIELTSASVCLVKSLHDFAGIETVVISADGSLLDERESYTLSLEDIVTMDMVTVEE